MASNPYALFVDAETKHKINKSQSMIAKCFTTSQQIMI